MTNDGKGQQGEGMTASGGTTKRHDDGNARHDDGDLRSWDGGVIFAQQGRSSLSIAVTGGGSLARRQRRRWEDLATSTSKGLISLRGWGGYDDDDVDPRGNDDNDTISLAMATATRVVGNEEGDGSKSDDDDTPISLAMATTTRVAGEEESDGGKSDGDDEKG